MRRLRGSAPSGIPGPGGGLCSLRRLRRSACMRRFFVMFVCTADAYILCAGCGDPGLLSFWLLPGTVPGSSGAFCICAGCVDPLAAFFLYDRIYIWGFYFVRRLRGSVPAACWLLPGMPCGLSVSLWCLFFGTDCIDLCTQTLDRNTCSRTVAS